MTAADIGRVSNDALFLAVKPARLKLKRAGERLGLVAPGQLVSVRGIGPLDRVAQQDEQLHAGQVTGDPLGGQRMKHVVRARLEGHRRGAAGPRGQARAGPQREMTLIPVKPPAVVGVEVVHTLVPYRLDHSRMLAERPVHGGRAAPLGAGDQEAGQHPGPVGQPARRHGDRVRGSFHRWEFG